MLQQGWCQEFPKTGTKVPDKGKTGRGGGGLGPGHTSPENSKIKRDLRVS